MKHIKVLDGIRGWAIIFVMLYHFTIPFQQSIGLNSVDFIFAKFLQMGWVGVDLFFVMSGFLITNILLSTQSKPNYYKNFYVRRILRIFPLYYGMLLILLIVMPAISDSFASKTATMQANSFWFWTYLVNWKVASLGTFADFQSGYMWSLAVEEQFYIVWPLIVHLFRNNLIKASSVLLFTSLLLKIWLLFYGASGTTIYTMTITHLDGLLLGSIFGSLYFHKKITSSLITQVGYFAVFASIGCVTLIITSGAFIFYSSLVGSIGVTFISIIFTYILLKAVRAEINTSLLTQPLVIKCGQLCYGLYLLHQPIAILVNEKLISSTSFVLNGSYIPTVILSSLICFVISLIVASVSYKLFELPLLKLKKYFT